MKVLDEGHQYLLESFQGNPDEAQGLQFIKKVQKMSGVSITDGTTNEEVLKMLIDRMNYLQSKFSCRENAIVITKLEEALMWLEKRTADRVERGVEGELVP